LRYLEGVAAMAHLIDVLSEKGLRTGEALPKADIHRLGRCHRGVHLFLFNRKRELLVQRRSHNVDYFPNLLTVSVTGHVDVGEGSYSAVRREFREELGVDDGGVLPTMLFSFFREVVQGSYIDRQFTDVYSAWTKAAVTDFSPDPEEVAELRFIAFDTFRELVARKDPDVVPVYLEECPEVAYFMGWNSGARARRRGA
jgi:isopentenyl-diphosphate delta-isomerase